MEVIVGSYNHVVFGFIFEKVEKVKIIFVLIS